MSQACYRLLMADRMFRRTHLVLLDAENCQHLADYAQYSKAAFIAARRIHSGQGWKKKYLGSGKGKGKHRFRRRKGKGKGKRTFPKRANAAQMGKGKGKRGSPPVGPRPLSKFKSKSFGRPKLSVQDRKDRLKRIKLNSKCKACGEKGHWLGDAECRFTKSDSRNDSNNRPQGRYATLNAPHVRYSESRANPYFCLLYTSPSPRDISGSRMPSSA